eukprot:9478167-Pyramimonas_sp.AAC.1
MPQMGSRIIGQIGGLRWGTPWLPRISWVLPFHGPENGGTNPSGVKTATNYSQGKVQCPGEPSTSARPRPSMTCTYSQAHITAHRGTH